MEYELKGEYIASRETITVGIDSAGKIDALPNAYSFAPETKLEKLFVKVGSEVKEGDALAEISVENLEEVILKLGKQLTSMWKHLIKKNSEES